MQEIELERHDDVALVRLNRPESLNSVNRAMREALIATLHALNADEGVRAVVIVGAGDRAFCSGQDLAETMQYTIDDVDEWLVATRLSALRTASRAFIHVSAARPKSPLR